MQCEVQCRYCSAVWQYFGFLKGQKEGKKLILRYVRQVLFMHVELLTWKLFVQVTPFNSWWVLPRISCCSGRNLFIYLDDFVNCIAPLPRSSEKAKMYFCHMWDDNKRHMADQHHQWYDFKPFKRSRIMIFQSLLNNNCKQFEWYVHHWEAVA